MRKELQALGLTDAQLVQTYIMEGATFDLMNFAQVNYLDETVNPLPMVDLDNIKRLPVGEQYAIPSNTGYTFIKRLS